jgi:CRP-like cAMP-binding protein
MDSSEKKHPATSLPGMPATLSTFAPLLQAARGNGLFSSLGDADAQILFSFCHFSFVEKDVKLIAEGDRADYLLFIADGRVDVVCDGADGQVLRVGTASVGAMLGETAITAVGQRSASVATASRCALGFLYHEDFKRLCAAHPDCALRFLIMMFNQMSGRMRAVAKQLTEANQVRSAAQTSLDLLSKVLLDRRVEAPNQAAR